MSDAVKIDSQSPVLETNTTGAQTEKSAGFRSFLKDFKAKVDFRNRIHRTGNQRITQSESTTESLTPTSAVEEAQAILRQEQTDSSNKANILKLDAQEKQAELVTKVFDNKKLETIKYAAFGIDDNSSPRLEENLAIIKADIGILAEAVEGLDANRLITSNTIINKLTTSNVPQVRELAQNYLAGNIDSYDKALNSPKFPTIRITETLQMLSRGLPSQPSEQSQRTTEVIMKHLDQSLKNPGSGGKAIETVERLLTSASSSETDKIEKIVLDTMNDPKLVNRLFIDGFVKYLRDKKSPLLDRALKLQNTVTQGYGLNPQELDKVWAKNSAQETGIPGFELSPEEKQRVALEIKEQNLTALHILEHERPGISKVLLKQFGIRNFARYPSDLLVKQYDDMGNSSLPYAVVLEPLFDPNGILYNETPKNFRHWAQKLGDKATVRIMECGNKDDVVTSLAAARRKYGKISSMIINVHGAENVLAFNTTDDKRNLLLFEDLSQPFQKTSQVGTEQVSRQVSPAAVFRYLFSDNATLLFLACSTGKESGIAQRISAFGLNTIAPAGDIKVIKCEPIIDEHGKIEFDFQYDMDVEKRYARGTSVGES